MAARGEDADRARFDGDVEDARLYEPLLARGAAVAGRLLKDVPAVPDDELPGSFRFIRTEAMRLVAAYPHPGREAEPGSRPTAADTMLSLLERSWQELAAGGTSGETIMRGRTGLWERFMTEWPLGSYARIVAQLLEERDLLHGRVLELGAGVGNTSRLVAAKIAGDYIRTDLVPAVNEQRRAPGTFERFDFNRPGRWRSLDLVFAVNALHCATSRPRTLAFIREMLRPGGALVLGEGVPETVPGMPWALTFLCGLFVGWWDVGGFVPRAAWLRELADVGFRDISYRRLISGSHDLGGVLAAVR